MTPSKQTNINLHESYPSLRSGTLPVDTTYRRGPYSDQLKTTGKTPRVFMQHRQTIGLTTRYRKNDPQNENDKLQFLANAVTMKPRYIGDIEYKTTLDRLHSLEYGLGQFGISSLESQIKQIKETILNAREVDFLAQTEELNQFVSESKTELWVQISETFSKRLGRLAGFCISRQHDNGNEALMPGPLCFDASNEICSVPAYSRVNGLYTEITPRV